LDKEICFVNYQWIKLEKQGVVNEFIQGLIKIIELEQLINECKTQSLISYITIYITLVLANRAIFNIIINPSLPILGCWCCQVLAFPEFDLNESHLWTIKTYPL